MKVAPALPYYGSPTATLLREQGLSDDSVRLPHTSPKPDDPPWYLQPIALLLQYLTNVDKKLYRSISEFSAMFDPPHPKAPQTKDKLRLLSQKLHENGFPNIPRL